VNERASFGVVRSALHVSAAELEYGRVEELGPLEVADVTGAGKHHEVRIGDCLLELARNAERRPHIKLAPDEQVGTAIQDKNWSVF
jgi:hypothetical protein